MENKKILLEVDELIKLIETRELLVIDTRGESDFLKGHIPGAVNFPGSALQEPESPRGELKSWKDLVGAFAEIGINNTGPLVIYDDSGLVPSARLFWVLEVLGRENQALLNGGWPAWLEKEGPVEKGPADSTKGNFTQKFDTTLIAFQNEVYESLNKSNSALVDTRSPAEYSGKTPSTLKNGHIPGAINIDWQNNIQDLFDPTLKPVEELETLYHQNGVTREKEIIVYCRTGNRSAHSYFTLKYLGYENVKNYAGSWLEWGNDPDMPVETGN